jgi:hypothetical protein
MTVTEQAHTFEDPLDVGPRLAALGLTEAVLRDALFDGVQHASSCTRHDPPTMAGTLVWGKSIRFIRDALVIEGWRANNTRNYPTTVHPDGNWQIAVSSGDENTGLLRPVRPPRTKNPKGPATKEVAERNTQQLVMFPELDVPENDQSEGVQVETTPAQTWVLIYHLDRKKKLLRSELSLPKSVGIDGRIDDWLDRLILGPISFDHGDEDDGFFDDLNDDDGGESIDIPIDRR